MSEIPKDTIGGLNGFDPAIQTENIAFDRADLVGCTECGRKNPPNRLQCLYCGRDLELEPELATALKPEWRKPDAWESGFNIVFVEARSEASVEKAARTLSLETTDLRRILQGNVGLPLARVADKSDANALLECLNTMGFSCRIVSDADLGAKKPPIRLRSITISDNGFGFVDFNTGAVTSVKCEDILVIVPGIVSSSRVDTLEKRKRKKETKLLDESATMSDELVLDIYIAGDQNGFRIQQAGFDFSCLGPDKGLLATENLRLLTVMLKDRSPNAKLVLNYTEVRYALGLVWEIESRRDSKGLVHVGFGKREFGAVSSTSNLVQFTKYSRLQQHLL